MLTMHLAARLPQPNGNKKSLFLVMPTRPSACYVRSIHYARERKRIMESRGRRALVSDAANTQFPPEEIRAQAQSNATAWVLTTIAYLKERNLSVEEYVAYHGRGFAPAWEELRGRPVEEVARLVALNAVSVGGALRSLSGDDGRVEVLVEGWPDEEFFILLPLDQADSDQIWNTYEPIMEHLDLRYAWQREDDVVRITVERQSGR